MARVNVEFGDLQASREIIDQVSRRLTKVLLPEMERICTWYQEQVASFQYVYFDGYPEVRERLKNIIMGANKSNGNLNVTINRAGDKIFFKIKIFDDAPGGYLDQQTDTGRGSGIGWWRYFEEGVPGQRNFGSTTHGFLPTGRRPDGRPTGVMVRAYSFGGGRPKPHPGVFKVGVFEATWAALRDQFVERIRIAVQEAIKKI